MITFLYNNTSDYNFSTYVNCSDCKLYNATRGTSNAISSFWNGTSGGVTVYNGLNCGWLSGWLSTDTYFLYGKWKTSATSIQGTSFHQVWGNSSTAGFTSGTSFVVQLKLHSTISSSDFHFTAFDPSADYKTVPIQQSWPTEALLAPCYKAYFYCYYLTSTTFNCAFMINAYKATATLAPGRSSSSNIVRYLPLNYQGNIQIVNNDTTYTGHFYYCKQDTSAVYENSMYNVGPSATSTLTGILPVVTDSTVIYRFFFSRGYWTRGNVYINPDSYSGLWVTNPTLRYKTSPSGGGTGTDNASSGSWTSGKYKPYKATYYFAYSNEFGWQANRNDATKWDTFKANYSLRQPFLVSTNTDWEAYNTNIMIPAASSSTTSNQVQMFLNATSTSCCQIPALSYSGGVNTCNSAKVVVPCFFAQQKITNFEYLTCQIFNWTVPYSLTDTYSIPAGKSIPIKFTNTATSGTIYITYTVDGTEYTVSVPANSNVTKTYDIACAKNVVFLRAEFEYTTKLWSATANGWVNATAYAWNGSEWKKAQPYAWNDSEWKVANAGLSS